MKRDWNMIREYIVGIADGMQPLEYDTTPQAIKTKGDYHLLLLMQGDFVFKNQGVYYLTLKGQDFADLCRDESRWEQIMATVEVFGGLPYEIITTLLHQGLEPNAKGYFVELSK